MSDRAFRPTKLGNKRAFTSIPKVIKKLERALEDCTCEITRVSLENRLKDLRNL